MFNKLGMPLFPVCIGLILGIIVAYFGAFWQNPLFSIYFGSLGFIASTVFLRHFSQSLLLARPLIYHALQVQLFFCVGIIIWNMQSLLVASLTESITTNTRNVFAVVDDISENAEGRYPFRVTLNLTPSSVAFYGKNLTLFLYKNFLKIGDSVVLQDFTLLPANLTDLKNGCLGMIFYQPQKTYLRKYRAFNLSFLHRLSIFKRKLCKRILNKMSELTRSFYGLIFLGYRQREVPVSLRELFQAWGISHYLARSGLHLTIFSYFCFFIFFLLPFGLFWRYLVAVAISVVYYLLTYASVSFLRAELMFVMAMFAKIFLRQSQQLHFLILTCMLVLLFNPYQLFALDFQLSFSLVFALLMVASFLAGDKRLTDAQ